MSDMQKIGFPLCCCNWQAPWQWIQTEPESQIHKQEYIWLSSTSPILKHVDTAWLWGETDLFRLFIHVSLYTDTSLPCTSRCAGPYKKSGWGKYRLDLSFQEFLPIKVNIIQRRGISETSHLDFNSVTVVASKLVFPSRKWTQIFQHFLKLKSETAGGITFRVFPILKNFQK